MTPPSLLLYLSLLWLPLAASSASILASPQSLTSVSCPATQTTFVATTEIVLEGRNIMLTKEERGELTKAFQGIYNALTQRSCDSYFRRIASLNWIAMTNGVGDSVLLMDPALTTNQTMDENSAMPDGNGTRRQLQDLGGFNDNGIPAAAPSANSNGTSDPGVSIVYEVTGTCRDCPLTRAGSFQLYDDSFRRALEEHSGLNLRMRQLEVKSSSTVTLSVSINKDQDCQCVQGTTPSNPQAPGVQECVDEMNLQFEAIRGDNPELFRDLEMTDLLQNDEGLLDANEDPQLASQLPLTSVDCPATQTTFVATTEMVFEGRSSFLTNEERGRLTSTFQQVYNGLTQTSCDSYFRRIASLSWVNMTNDQGETMLFTGPCTGSRQGGNRRYLQDNNPTSAPTTNFNGTSIPGVSIVYEVTGTCRDCPLTRGGGFELYDDALRRTLQEKSGLNLHMRQLEVKSSSTVTLSVSINPGTNREDGADLIDNLDCQCVEGATPTVPQAPGVQECVDEMNTQFESIQDSSPELFQDLAMTDLLQTDEGVLDLVEAELQEAEEATEFDSEVDVERTNIISIRSKGSIGKSKENEHDGEYDTAFGAPNKDDATSSASVHGRRKLGLFLLGVSFGLALGLDSWT